MENDIVLVTATYVAARAAILVAFGYGLIHAMRRRPRRAGVRNG